eukprot:CAMPEP_0175290458 /NCGR_PEP_ID=MMETSP0093-20121207/55884_1 /TAXON_ID=311494 /ORGANISM="Alexandrium monilatum, Strain CCMP3105" /LENGTH=131 /DNA_ID=CAMNT_0016586145 /DNA_START=90 /DNA_END=483 /DNA_ORIENTATION=-
MAVQQASYDKGLRVLSSASSSGPVPGRVAERPPGAARRRRLGGAPRGPAEGESAPPTGPQPGPRGGRGVIGPEVRLPVSAPGRLRRRGETVRAPPASLAPGAPRRSPGGPFRRVPDARGRPISSVSSAGCL